MSNNTNYMPRPEDQEQFRATMIDFAKFEKTKVLKTMMAYNEAVKQAFEEFKNEDVSEETREHVSGFVSASMMAFLELLHDIAQEEIYLPLSEEEMEFYETMRAGMNA